MSVAFAAKSWCWDDRICHSSASSTAISRARSRCRLFGTLILAAMLLVLDKMLRLFQYVVDAGGPVSVVWRMLANLLPEYLSLGIPIGLMLGILLAFRKLALSSELDALRGIGVGYGRLLRVPYVYAIPLVALNLVHRRLSPALHALSLRRAAFDLKSGALGAAIKVGEFNQLGKRLTLRIDRSENKGTQLHGIFVQNDDSQGDDRRRDRRARPVPVDRRSRHVILFRLTKGRLVQDSPKFTTPRTLAFDSYDLPVSLPAIDQFRGRGGTECGGALPRTSCGGSATAARARRHVAADRRRGALQLPPGRGGDDADAAAARGRARGAAQAQHRRRSASSSRS